MLILALELSYFYFWPHKFQISRCCSLVNHSKRQCHPTSDMSLNFPRGGSVTAVDISPWVEVEHQARDLKATNPTMFQQDLGVVQAEVIQVQVAHG